MTSRTGMRIRISREGVCGNNAVQFQSYVGSSYCTALGENCCTYIVSRQLRDSFMVRRAMVRAIHWRHNEKCGSKIVSGDVRTKCAASILQNRRFPISEVFSGHGFLFKTLSSRSPLQALEVCNENFRTSCRKASYKHHVYTTMTNS